MHCRDHLWELSQHFWHLYRHASSSCARSLLTGIAKFVVTRLVKLDKSGPADGLPRVCAKVESDFKLKVVFGFGVRGSRAERHLRLLTDPQDLVHRPDEFRMIVIIRMASLNRKVACRASLKFQRILGHSTCLNIPKKLIQSFHITCFAPCCRIDVI